MPNSRAAAVAAVSWGSGTGPLATVVTMPTAMQTAGRHQPASAAKQAVFERMLEQSNFVRDCRIGKGGLTSTCCLTKELVLDLDLSLAFRASSGSARLPGMHDSDWTEGMVMPAVSFSPN